MHQSSYGRVLPRVLLILAILVASVGPGGRSVSAAPVSRVATSETAPLSQEPFGMAETVVLPEPPVVAEESGTVVPIPNLWEVPPPQPLEGAEADLHTAASEGTMLDETGGVEAVRAAETGGADGDTGAAGVAQVFAPDLLAPQSSALITGATDPPTGVPTLRWNAAPNAERYQIQISVSPGFASTLVSQETYALSYTPVIALADGTYYWRVRSRSGRDWSDYSEVWSFTKDWSDSRSLRPVLISPADTSEIAHFAPEHFSWESLPGAASYVLEIATDFQFNQIVYSDTTIKPHHTPTARLANSPYFWRVVPLDTKGNRGAASDVWRFTYLWDMPPELLAPADNLATPFLPQFSWSPVEGARRYQLEISTQNDLTNANIYVTANTDFTPEKALGNDQDYYWRVKAIDANNVSTRYSEIRSFTMEWNFQPQLLTPANNAIMLSFPHFTWTPVPEAERYEIQIAPNAGFQNPIGKAEVYNVTAYTQPSWRDVYLMVDYSWRVRAIDAQKNYGPWSDI